MATKKKPTKRAKARRTGDRVSGRDVLLLHMGRKVWRRSADGKKWTDITVPVTAKRRTSDKIASLSGRVMADLRAARKEKGGTKKTAADFVTLGELWAMAGSLLVQDEHRGLRAKGRQR